MSNNASARSAFAHPSGLRACGFAKPCFMERNSRPCGTRRRRSIRAYAFVNRASPLPDAHDTEITPTCSRLQTRLPYSHAAFGENGYPLNTPAENNTEAGCRDYIRRLRWPDGFVCGCCGVIGEPWIMARGVFRCKACHGNTSLTAGTVLQDTRKPLRT